MNAVENQVRELVSVELASANKKFPQFHSPHEGWAVILEEIKELCDECKHMKKESKQMFDFIMENQHVNGFVNGMKRHAIYAACEAIQVAAMAQKFIDMVNANE